MQSSELKALCENILSPIQKVGAYIAHQQSELRDLTITTKSLNSLVSKVDIEAEHRLVEILRQELPSASYLTEEKTTVQSESELLWIIDPLDGTTNFLHGLPHYSISVALEIDRELVLGVVYDCAKKECFYAWKGGGAWLNGKAIQVSSASSLDQSLLATGFPYYDFEKMPGYLAVLEYFMRHTRGLRRFGSAALDLAWVACGRYEGFFEYGLNPWDVAAGIVLIREAEGRITDFSNGPTVSEGKEILGTNGKLHQRMLEQVANKLSP